LRKNNFYFGHLSKILTVAKFPFFRGVAKIQRIFDGVVK
jgi:hypothetical protein